MAGKPDGVPRGADRLQRDLKAAKAVQDPDNPPGISDVPKPAFVQDDEAGDEEEASEGGESPKNPPQDTPEPPKKPEARVGDVDLKIQRMHDRLREAVFKDDKPDAPITPKLPPEIQKKLAELRANGDNKEADELVVEETAKAIQAGDQVTRAQREQRAAFYDSRKRAHEAIFKAHPEVLETEIAILDKKTPPKPTRFQEILEEVYNEYPEFESSPTGPLKAMRRAEERMENEELKAKLQQVVSGGDPDRAARAAAASVTSGGVVARPGAPGGAPQGITEEQAEIARRLGITPQAYMKRLQSRSQRGFKIHPQSFYTDSNKLPKRRQG